MSVYVTTDNKSTQFCIDLYKTFFGCNNWTVLEHWAFGVAWYCGNACSKLSQTSIDLYLSLSSLRSKVTWGLPPSYSISHQIKGLTNPIPLLQQMFRQNLDIDLIGKGCILLGFMGDGPGGFSVSLCWDFLMTYLNFMLEKTLAHGTHLDQVLFRKTDKNSNMYYY